MPERVRAKRKPPAIQYHNRTRYEKEARLICSIIFEAYPPGEQTASLLSGLIGELAQYRAVVGGSHFFCGYIRPKINEFRQTPDERQCLALFVAGLLMEPAKGAYLERILMSSGRGNLARA
jgi:hypothetical protein